MHATGVKKYLDVFFLISLIGNNIYWPGSSPHDVYLHVWIKKLKVVLLLIITMDVAVAEYYDV